MTNGRRALASMEGDLRVAIEAWRARPTRERTLAACNALSAGHAPPPPRVVVLLVRHALQMHRMDAEVLVAVGRLQMEAGDLRGAHHTLARAESIVPTASAPPRWLGDVLLRLGDARRAVLAFEQARLRASSVSDALPFDDSPPRSIDDALERAIALCALQSSEGELAVAADVASAPRHPSRSGVHARVSTRPTCRRRVDPALVRDDAPTRAMRPPTELLDALRLAEGVDTPLDEPVVERDRQKRENA